MLNSHPTPDAPAGKAAGVLDYSNPDRPKFAVPGFFNLPVFHRLMLEVTVCLFPVVLLGGGQNAILSTLTLFVVCSVAVFWLNQRRRRFPAEDETSRRYWRATTYLVVAMCVSLVQFDRCPHTTYWMVGPFEFATGRRCWNPRYYRNVVTWPLSKLNQ